MDAVSWEFLKIVLTAVAGSASVMWAIARYYFKQRESDNEQTRAERAKEFSEIRREYGEGLREMREMIKNSLTAIDHRHEKLEAANQQEHQNLHDRVERAKKNTLDTERQMRSEMTESIRQTEERLTGRINALSNTIEAMGTRVIAAVHERHRDAIQKKAD